MILRPLLYPLSKHRGQNESLEPKVKPEWNHGNRDLI